MVAIGKHPTASSRDSVDRTCEARSDGFHTAPKCIAITSLDDQMRVVALKRVMHEPELRALAPA